MLLGLLDYLDPLSVPEILLVLVLHLFLDHLHYQLDQVTHWLVDLLADLADL